MTHRSSFLKLYRRTLFATS